MKKHFRIIFLCCISLYANSHACSIQVCDSIIRATNFLSRYGDAHVTNDIDYRIVKRVLSNSECWLTSLGDVGQEGMEKMMYGNLFKQLKPAIETYEVSHGMSASAGKPEHAKRDSLIAKAKEEIQSAKGYGELQNLEIFWRRELSRYNCIAIVDTAVKKRDDEIAAEQAALRKNEEGMSAEDLIQQEKNKSPKQRDIEFICGVYVMMDNFYALIKQEREVGKVGGYVDANKIHEYAEGVTMSKERIKNAEAEYYQEHGEKFSRALCK